MEKGGVGMSEIKNILVTTDFSDTSAAAFSLARQLAKKFDARIVLLHVLHLVETHIPPLVYGSAGLTAGRLQQEYFENARSRLEAIKEQFGENIEVSVVPGTPHVEIVSYANDNKIDMIVMATHGRGFFSHAILGSTTERVVRRASCPVLTVKNPEVGVPHERSNY